MKRLAFILLLLVVCVPLLAQQPVEPLLKSGEAPRYPPIARLARIEGDVVMEFTVTESGSVASCSIISGHPMLVGAAESAVDQWKFSVPNGMLKGESKFQTTIHFQLTEGADYSMVDEHGNTMVPASATLPIVSFREVWVKTPALSGKSARECPVAAKIVVPKTRSGNDYVKLDRGYYAVTVWANGRVEWEGLRAVEVVGESESQINPGTARELLDRFADKRFWSLCGDYSISCSDCGGDATIAEIGEMRKKVSQYGAAGPPLVGNLEEVIDDVADTHQWRHGDPKEEPISRIGEDVASPKPGKTRLMKATGDEDSKNLESFLAAGDDPNAEDASGWSVLMYAAASNVSGALHSIPVQRLLKAGADPNHASLLGDTPLMASAIHGHLDTDLLAAGSDINAQNKDGVTVLMMLAARGEAENIETALKAGANAKLKDSKGRTALDYLVLASCGKSPLADQKMEWFHTEYGECNALDADNVAKSKELLTKPILGR